MTVTGLFRVFLQVHECSKEEEKKTLVIVLQIYEPQEGTSLDHAPSESHVSVTEPLTDLPSGQVKIFEVVMPFVDVV